MSNNTTNKILFCIIYINKRKLICDKMRRIRSRRRDLMDEVLQI